MAVEEEGDRGAVLGAGVARVADEPAGDAEGLVLLAAGVTPGRPDADVPGAAGVGLS